MEGSQIVDALGLIEMRYGWNGGAFINFDFSDKISENLDMQIKNNLFSFDDLAEFRAKLEGEMAKNAALNIKNKDVSKLISLLEKTEQSAK